MARHQTIIERLPPNHQRRDWVVGDLHGCRSLLNEGLQRVDFNPEGGDRLLCVGDLTDRGPESVACLELLLASWFHSVRGNHDDMIRDWLEAPPGSLRRIEAAHLLLANGADTWAQDLLLDPDPADHPLMPLLHMQAELPHVLVVGSGAGRFQLVHAELVSPGAPQGLLSDADIDAGLPGVDPTPLLWSRRLMGRLRSPLPERSESLSTTYCGHTVGRTLRRRLSHVCLDTGAFVRVTRGTTDFGLTLVNPQSGEVVFVP
ncbi:metallophosphoesterase [Alkalilimnicola ehrlichii MLHE-1]|uniref:Metallophosphoesterase n=1 Tax=Alkalilimnicola ehrlichii (strain ATCC BAA-1101 / DSM 17681 / MLHE-1) TaxID=187272 RepID=Q0A9T4_ALKEH|nr:metallophosphoesterase [Alkalilimnicola ehrlichii]ABI56403.1 metallophosphoesterase [Alkalilimnicola ehrlichii MLHE-1]